MDNKTPDFRRKDLVIMVHMGNQGYLKDILDITVHFGNTVLLVGDKTNKRFVDNINSFHFLADKYSKRADEFKKIYKHYSSLSPEWEIRSLANVFILHEFMKSKGIENCFHCEADCVLLVPVKSLNFGRNINYMVKAKGFDNKFKMAHSIHSSYLNLRFLELYDELCFQIYKNGNDMFKLIEPKIEWHKKTKAAGGICNMTFFYLIAQRMPIKDLQEPMDYQGEPCVFENIRQEAKSHNDKYFYQMENGSKKTFIKANKAYLVGKDKKLYRTLNLHFQGSSKPEIKYFKKKLGIKAHSLDGHVLHSLRRAVGIFWRMARKCFGR